MPDDPYVYPGTSVLRNRFGVHDAGELMSPAARGGRDPRAASFPTPAAYATRAKATPAQRRSAAPPGREPGVER